MPLCFCIWTYELLVNTSWKAVSILQEVRKWFRKNLEPYQCLREFLGIQLSQEWERNCKTWPIGSIAGKVSLERWSCTWAGSPVEGSVNSRDSVESNSPCLLTLIPGRRWQLIQSPHHFRFGVHHFMGSKQRSSLYPGHLIHSWAYFLWFDFFRVHFAHIILILPSTLIGWFTFYSQE